MYISISVPEKVIFLPTRNFSPKIECLDLGRLMKDAIHEGRN